MTKMHQLDFDKPVTDRYALFDEWRGRYGSSTLVA